MFCEREVYAHRGALIGFGSQNIESFLTVGHLFFFVEMSETHLAIFIFFAIEF